MVSPIYYFTRSGCAWCTRMQPSIEQINKTLNDEQKIQILNIDDKKSRVLFDNLSKQMSNKVRWVESIKCLDNLNETKIIEIGPGKVLSGLIKRISKNFIVNNINCVNDLDYL